MIIRIRYTKAGAHYDCSVFTAKSENHTFARAGMLVFSESEWEAIQAAMPNVQFLEVGEEPKMKTHRCPDCGSEIDPDYCHCGTKMDEHTQADNHHGIPMGCSCYRGPA